MKNTLQLSIFDAEKQPRFFYIRAFSVRNPDNIFSFATFHTVTRKRKRKPGKVWKWRDYFVKWEKKTIQPFIHPQKCKGCIVYYKVLFIYNSHFNSHLNSHFLFSRSGNSFLKNSHFSEKNSHFYLIRSGNLSGN